MSDDSDTLAVTIGITGGSTGDSGAVGATYSGFVPGYGPTPAIINGSGNGIYTIGATTPPNYHTNIHISGPNPVLTTDKGKIDLNELAEMMKVMRERLLILVPDFEKHEKYEALKKAYDHYKLIEAMIIGKENEQR